MKKAEYPQIIMSDELVKEARLLMKLVNNFSERHGNLHLDLNTWGGSEHSEMSIYDCEKSDETGFYCHRIRLDGEPETSFIKHDRSDAETVDDVSEIIGEATDEQG